MYHIQIAKKACFNKSRAIKAQLLEQFVHIVPTTSCSNGNSGYASEYIRPVLAYLDNCIVRSVGGDPHTPNHVLLDTNKLTKEQVNQIKNWLKPVEGTHWKSAWVSFMAIARKQVQPWITLDKILNGAADPVIVRMFQIGLDNDKLTQNRWVRKHSTFDSKGNMLQVGYAEEIKGGFEYIFDGWCLYRKEDVQFKPATDKYRAEWRSMTGEWIRI